MVLGVIGTCLAMGALYGYSSKNNKKAYPKMNNKISNDMDAEYARYGIKGKNGRFTDTQIRMIAARNNVKTDEYGVLPEQGWKKCRQYVAGYANDDKDILEFEDAWYTAVANQLKAKRRKISQKDTDYKSNNRYFNAPSHKSEWQQQTIVLELKHWHGIPKEEQIKRMKELQEKTYWGQLCAEEPILRHNPRVPDSYVEVWILHASNKHTQGSKKTNSTFKNWYKECCTKLGYEHGL